MPKQNLQDLVDSVKYIQPTTRGHFLTISLDDKIVGYSYDELIGVLDLNTSEWWSYPKDDATLATRQHILRFEALVESTLFGGAL